MRVDRTDVNQNNAARKPNTDNTHQDIISAEHQEHSVVRMGLLRRRVCTFEMGTQALLCFSLPKNNTLYQYCCGVR